MSRLSSFKRVWVSGGSRGIGLGLANYILKENPASSVWITARRVDGPECSHLEKLRDQYGESRVSVAELDITDQVALNRMAEQIAHQGENKLDAVINTVGLLHDDCWRKANGKGGQPEKRLKDIDADWAIENFKVNAIGPLLLARAVVEQNVLDRSKWTCLANLSAKVGSVSDNQIGSWYSYRASKAAQNQINKCVAIELQRMKRKTVCVGLHPGTVDSQLSAPFSKNIKHELFTVEKAAEQLFNVIYGLNPENDNGKLFSWDGSEIKP